MCSHYDFGSTTTSSAEYFGLETYRIVSGNYVSQSNVTSSGNSWNSTYSINDIGSYPEHGDGMVSANGYLISPFQIGNDGDTRNTADGGSLQAPASNPNYSTLTNAMHRLWLAELKLNYNNDSSVEIMSFLEPNKIMQNSFTLIKKNEETETGQFNPPIFTAQP